MKYLKAIWEFCSFLFVPQWGRHRSFSNNYQVDKNTNQGDMILSPYYPHWLSFAYKYQGREQSAFENLARNLFRRELGVKRGLLQRVNHKGNETEVVKKDGKVIGFQAKFFSNGINADDIIDSMTAAKDANPSQTHYYIYCNQSFGNPRRRKGAKKTDPIPDKTYEEEKIENAAKGLGLDIIWKLDKAILDEVNEDENLRKVFFEVFAGGLEKKTEKCANSNEALKKLYDLIIDEANQMDTCVIIVMNRGGIDWFNVIENRYPMYNSVYAIKDFIETNRFFFTNSTYVKINNYFKLARDLSGALEAIVMAIYSAEDQDAITSVYDLTYEQDIHCNAQFVREMMTAFKTADDCYAYEDFAEKYEIHEEVRKEILELIDSKRDVAI